MTSRRLFLAGTVAAVSGLAGCSSADRPGGDRQSATPPGSTPGTPGTSGTPGTPGAPGKTPAQPRPTAEADIVRGPADVPAVALTFHGAGEVALARRVLSEAAAGGAHLTVLAVGTWLAGTPALAREILDGGHELGNHTWSHPQMPQLGAAAAEAEVRRAADLLRRLTGTPGRYFRPSGTPHSTPVIRAAALRAGYDRCLSYDLDPLDYTDPAPDVVAGRVLAGVGKGSIVSLHLGHSPTVQALPVILDGLRRRGLRAVTMTQLLTGA